MTQTTHGAGALVALEADEGEALWFNNDLLTFKATGAQTAGAYLLVEELARQGKVTPLHIHPHETETFYVVEGGLRMHIEGEERTVAAGGFVSVPPGVRHAYMVSSRWRARCCSSRRAPARWRRSSARRASRRPIACSRRRPRSI